MLELFKIYFGFNFRGGATFIHVTAEVRKQHWIPWSWSESSCKSSAIGGEN